MENVQTSETNGTSETSQAPATNGASAASETPMTAERAKALLDNIEKDSPARWPAAVRTLVVKAFESIERVSQFMEILLQAVGRVGSGLETLRKDHDKLVASHRRLAAVIIALQEGGPSSKPVSPPGGEAFVNPAQETPAESPPADVVGAAADGAPGVTLPQSEAEAMMDAAIAAADEKGPVAPPESMKAPSSGGKRRR